MGILKIVFQMTVYCFALPEMISMKYSISFPGLYLNSLDFSLHNVLYPLFLLLKNLCVVWGTGAQNQRQDWTTLKYAYIYTVAGLLFQ